MNRKPVETQHLVVMFTQDHLTLREIATRVGISHAAVWKRLKVAGIQRESGTWVKVACSFCGAQIRKHRANWRKSEKHYCRPACYYADLERHGYTPWRSHQGTSDKQADCDAVGWRISLIHPPQGPLGDTLAALPRTRSVLPKSAYCHSPHMPSPFISNIRFWKSTFILTQKFSLE